MHNGKKERIITRTTITILLKLLNYYKQQQTTRVKAPITTKKKKSPHCERSIVASGSLLPSNRVQQKERECSVKFRILLQPEIVARQNDLRGNEREQKINQNFS